MPSYRGLLGLPDTNKDWSIDWLNHDFQWEEEHTFNYFSGLLLAKLGKLKNHGPDGASATLTYTVNPTLVICPVKSTPKKSQKFRF